MSSFRKYHHPPFRTVIPIRRTATNSFTVIPAKVGILQRRHYFKIPAFAGDDDIIRRG